MSGTAARSFFFTATAICVCVWALSGAPPHDSSLIEFTGRVLDESGQVIPSASVCFYTATGALIGKTTTSENGQFAARLPATGLDLMVIEAPGFEPERRPVDVQKPRMPGIVLSLAPQTTQITVTASRSTVEDIQGNVRTVSSRDREYLALRPATSTAHALGNVPGVTVQQTTQGQGSPLLRGLTGYQTLILIDGVRFNTAIMRSGPNQYLSFADPSHAGRIEAVMGPNSAAWGSDSLGGTIHVIGVESVFASRRPREVHGELNILGSSGDLARTASGRMTFAADRTSFGAAVSTRWFGDLRGGRGVDSHNILTRYFGLGGDAVRDIVGDRMQDTAFHQQSAEGRFSRLIGSGHMASARLLWSGIGNVRSYRDLWGGFGRIQSLVTPQDATFGYFRWEGLGPSAFGKWSGTFSFNRWNDGSVKQTLRASDPVVTDDSTITAIGYAGQSTRPVGEYVRLIFGGELYQERLDSSRVQFDPVKRIRSFQRPGIPNGSHYATAGAFLQADVRLASNLKTTVGTRFTRATARTRAASNVSPSGQSLGVADSDRSFHDLTWNAATNWQITRPLGVHFVIARGFRAPNLNDLGTVGLTTSGYEVPTAEAAAAGALLSSDSGDAAYSLGRPLAEMKPEHLISYEAGVRVAVGKVRGRVQAFRMDLTDPIVGRSVLFPAGRVPASVAGVPVLPLPQSALQAAQGVVAVYTPVSVRAIRAITNDGQTRLYGGEASGDIRLTHRLTLEAAWWLVYATDLNPNRVSRRIPPGQGYLTLRYVPSGRRPWMEASFRGAGIQTRMNSGDIDDERIGASRRRSDIADVFRGFVLSQYIDAGPDGKPGTADDFFRPTGETLLAIQNRVLPTGAVVNGTKIVNDSSRVPLYTTTPGWLTVDVNGGIPLTDHVRLGFGIQNLLDRNYRMHGSGTDAPGLNIWFSLRMTF